MPSSGCTLRLAAGMRFCVRARACRCGAHARALLYFESWVREKQGGGLNPPAMHSSVQYTGPQVRLASELQVAVTGKGKRLSPPECAVLCTARLNAPTRSLSPSNSTAPSTPRPAQRRTPVATPAFTTHAARAP